MSKYGEAGPWDRPPKISEGSKNLHRASTVEADSSNRPKLSSPSVLPWFNANLIGDGFTSDDELEEMHNGPSRADVHIECLG